MVPPPASAPVAPRHPAGPLTAATAGLALVAGLLMPLLAGAQVSVSITIAPPPLLVYAQPPVPAPGSIWMPGYWSWSNDEASYFWVPGTWVLAPRPGELWTPGYWAFESVGFFWHAGYWGPRVGFYGGINYGYGYFGSGYQGGRWERGAFRYNRAVSNVRPRFAHDAYNAPAAPVAGRGRVSFNGGQGGVKVRPTVSQRELLSAEHAGPRDEQLQHETAARGLPTQRSTGPHGVPQVAATPRPSAFSAPEVEHGRAAPAVRNGRPKVAAPEAGRPTKHPGDATHSERREPPAARRDHAGAPAPRSQPDHPQPRGRVARPEAPRHDSPSRKEP